MLMHRGRWTCIVKDNCTMSLLDLEVLSMSSEDGCPLCLPSLVLSSIRKRQRLCHTFFDLSRRSHRKQYCTNFFILVRASGNYVLLIAHNVSHTPIVTNITTLEQKPPPVSDQFPQLHQWRNHTSRSHTHILRHHERKRRRRFLPPVSPHQPALCRI